MARLYQVHIRKDIGKSGQTLSRGLTSGGIAPSSGSGGSGTYEYRSVPVVTGTFQNATQIARTLCGKDEEVVSVDLSNDCVVVDTNVDLGGD